MKKFIFILLAVVALTATVAVAATGNVNIGTVYQELEGFGASHVWSGSTLVTLGDNNPEIYDVIFGDLGLDILRLRNTYGYDSGYINNCEHAITNGRARTGRPLKIMISSWSPQASLKSNGDVIGGGNATLAGGPSNYVYGDYADWWADSLEQYASQGIDADYISMQNEPDWDATSYDSCRFEPSETSSIAGYDQAFEAVYSEIYSRMGSSMPKMLAPETTGFQGASGSGPSAYLSALNLSHVYGYAHHLYNCNDGGNAGCAANPDNYISNMTSFGNTYGDKPILQTEYSDDSHVTSHDACMDLAVLMHNSLVEEGAAGYLYWQLAYGSGQGLVSITESSWTINPIYYAMMHYSAFTDPGWHRVGASTDSGNLRISAYLSSGNNELSIVVINTSSSSIDLSLSLGAFSPTASEVYRTSSTENAEYVGTFDGSLTLPGQSITTISLTSGGTTSTTTTSATTSTTTTAATTSTTTTAATTSTTTTTSGGGCDCGTCDWYGTNIPMCCESCSGWGWYDGGCRRSCVCPSSCEGGCVGSQCGSTTTTAATTSTTTTAATTSTTTTVATTSTTTTAATTSTTTTAATTSTTTTAATTSTTTTAATTSTTTTAATTSTTSTTTTSGGGGCTCDSGCDGTSKSVPFSQNGSGTYCWQVSDSINYINSWSLGKLEINGVDYTNIWSNSMPAGIDGVYYIYYEGSVPWSHFEAN